MSTPRFVQIYQSLPDPDKKRFLLFVGSPYFNTREKLVQLADYVRHRTEEEEDWDAGAASAAIFNDSNQQKPLTNLLSDLNRLMEQFLATEALAQQPELMETALAKGMSAIPVPSATKAYLRRKQRMGVSDPLSLHYINRLADQFYFQQTREHSNEELLESQHNLTVYYLTRQLKTWCELLNRSNILSLTYDEQALHLFLQVIEYAGPTLHEYPLAGLYHAIFQWMQEPGSDDWYYRLKGQLFHLLEQIEEEEAKEICAYIQNYCVKRINEGRQEFLQELFNLFRFMLEQELVLDGSVLSQWTYKNIVTVGLRLKAFEETEEFIHTWYQRLPEKDRDNAYYYNLAALHYESHDYAKAKKLLSRVHFTDPVYYLDGHAILLKIYFEEGAEDAIISLNETVRIYLLRLKLLNKQQIQLYRNLFRFTLRLYRLRHNAAHLSAREQHQILNKILLEADAQLQVANRQWLLMQAESTKAFLKVPPPDEEEGDAIEEDDIDESHS